MPKEGTPKIITLISQTIHLGSVKKKLQSQQETTHLIQVKKTVPGFVTHNQHHLWGCI